MCPKAIHSCEATLDFPHHYSSHMIFRNYANLLLKTFLIIITAENKKNVFFQNSLINP